MRLMVSALCPATFLRIIESSPLRLALPTFQHHGHRLISRRATPASQDSRRSTAPIVALPARSIVVAPFPSASRSVVRLTGRVDYARTRVRLRSSRSRHARILRLDSLSSLLVHRPAPAPAGLAAFAGSRRPPRRTGSRCRARLRLPTHHLHRLPDAFRHTLKARRKTVLNERRQS